MNKDEMKRLQAIFAGEMIRTVNIAIDNLYKEEDNDWKGFYADLMSIYSTGLSDYRKLMENAGVDVETIENKFIASLTVQQ